MNPEFFPLILSGLFVLLLAAVGLAFVFYIRSKRLKKLCEHYHKNSLWVCEMAGYKDQAKIYQQEFEEDFQPIEL